MAKRRITERDGDEGEDCVICPECGNEQADMGAGVTCEECGYGPMPRNTNDDDE